MREAEARLKKQALASNRIEWVYQTHITGDTELLSSQASELSLANTGDLALRARRYNGLPLSKASQRKLKFLQLNLSFASAADRNAFAQLSTSLTGAYGTAQYCKKPGDPASCQTLGQLKAIMAKSRDPAELKANSISPRRWPPRKSMPRA